jgi:2-polyprenylphenol 6-hydroxylase
MRQSVVIAGGGPVGFCLGLALSSIRGIEVELIEREAAQVWQPPAGFDHRVYALSPMSMALLDQLGVQADPQRAAPVHAMQIWGDAREDSLGFDQGSPLATIVEFGALMAALQETSAGRFGVRHGVSVSGCESGSRIVRLSDGSCLDADLLIAADGQHSPLRAMMGIAADRKDYGAVGVVANFDCAIHHGDVARQWFLGDSVLALLPLPGARVSMVWSMAEARARTIDATTVGAEVEAACGSALGALEAISPIGRFPLARVRTHSWVLPGFALVGDAAHTVHPLAGQGVNLGFGDVAALAGLLRDRSRFSSVGDLSLLRRYERARREAAWAVGEMTDRLQRLYVAPGEAETWIRNRGLSMLDRLPSLKAQLAGYAMR